MTMLDFYGIEMARFQLLANKKQNGGDHRNATNSQKKKIKTKKCVPPADEG